ncbi:hypothetical protein OWV82_010664 [Melia azedarach]|uniref:Uncharacterized protein n=1 Tax=Melia azedarach TaxID=155640 RepID=A0ACC1Y601_MELAZ|nr:hypothetical protein OWV82_010664 [Melia azedarach]
MPAAENMVKKGAPEVFRRAHSDAQLRVKTRDTWRAGIGPLVSREWSLRPYPRLRATWHALIRVGDYIIPCAQVASAHSPPLVVPHRLTISDIPSSVKLSLPRPGFRPSRPESNEVVIHRQSFEYSLRLPIQPFFAQILSGLGVAPAQLSSMAWQNLAGLYILWKEVLDIEPTIEDVHAIFALTTAPKKPELYYLRTYTGQPHLVPQVNPNTTDKAWDDFWFVVSRKWTRDLSQNTDLKSMREYVVTNPSETDIITEERLAKVRLIPPPSSVRDKMAKAAGTPSQRAATGSEGPGKSVVTSSGLPPRPKRAKKVEGLGWTPQLPVDLRGILGGHFAHASRALLTLKQVLEFSDSEKGSEVVGLNPNQAIDMASHLFLQGSFLMSQFGDKLKEGSTSAGRVAKLKVQLSRLTQKVKDKDDQISKLQDHLREVRDEVTREFPDLDLHYMDFGFDRDALVAKFGKEQNPADVAGSSRQLTS